MLYYFLYPLRDFFFGFNVFRYITFRAAMASITAFVVSLFIGPFVIRFLHRLELKQTVQRDGFSKLYKAHAGKDEVPMMGGLLILGALATSTLLWADLGNRYVWICLLVMSWLGLVGFTDDYLKFLKKDSKGLKAAAKLLGQVSISAGLGLFLYFDSTGWQEIHVPFLKDFVITLGPFYVLFAVLVVTGASNAVNLTDGLDGLAIGCTAMIALAYGLLSYVTGNIKISEYLHVPFVPGAGELTVFCLALFGAGMGFLWFNSHPASVFMGDTGSLSLGGALGAVALFTKKELLLLIIGGVFVVEALSVILQVASFKCRKKRVFLMAPIHHHFQLKGFSESKVVIRFWIVSLILALVGLASLKLQ
ncbi:MAG: phospho-N-acetylmuramoyl-pentapeptide-transferase [Candidatus Omnitrophica bacterium CG07_land_8_20_14_0_80_50_8]|nr:MAG: phospho-N-acetylmuramoyl-pentapeptide-transferase [Candidatus Omnitrophica bacterium CG07_land_8_20_14_0_80_50_8]